jgi:hypothetical protein
LSWSKLAIYTIKNEFFFENFSHQIWGHCTPHVGPTCQLIGEWIGSKTHRIAIWEAFLPKMQCFSHPSSPYPPRVPAGYPPVSHRGRIDLTTSPCSLCLLSYIHSSSEPMLALTSPPAGRYGSRLPRPRRRILPPSGAVDREEGKGLFGRAPAPAPRAAPAGALPNSVNCTGSRCGAGAGAPRGFQRGGGATFWWFHLAPTRNPPEELFCQTIFKMTQLHQRSHSTRGARAGAVFEGAGALPNKP